jgi:hypothetical protein
MNRSFVALAGATFIALALLLSTQIGAPAKITFYFKPGGVLVLPVAAGPSNDDDVWGDKGKYQKPNIGNKIWCGKSHRLWDCP